MPASPSWRAILLGCLALAVVLLFVLPRDIAYDPWSWLIWGREIAHLSLDTRNAATAVKPLPIFINTLFSPTGSLAPLVWLVIARAATLLALALAFRLGHRLGGPGAGVVAAVGLAVSNEFLGYLLIQAMSEPMGAAAVLAAVDCHLQSRRRWAFACLIAAGLLRPEAWPFLIAYGLWLAYLRLTWQRALGVVVAVAVPLVWFVIDWFGSRQFFRSAGAATHQSQGGPLLSRQPGLATVRETWHLMSAPILVLFLLGFGAALLAWARGGRPAPTVWLGLGAFGWLAVDAALAQGRFATGAARYLLPGVALACVVAGVFVADIVRGLSRLRSDARVSVVAAVLVGLALVASLSPRVVTTGRQVHTGVSAGRAFARVATNLSRAVVLAGGRDAVIGCGPVTTQAFQVPLVAWQLHVPVGDVRFVPPGTGTVLQQRGAPRVPTDISSNYRFVGTVGSARSRWTVLTACPAHAAAGSP